MQAVKTVAFFIFCFWALTGHGDNVAAQVGFCKQPNKAIHAGEELQFHVYYRLAGVWVGAGEAQFQTKSATYRGNDCYHIVGSGRTYSSYDWIFKVRDRYETYLDKRSLKPLYFKRDVSEGKTKFSRSLIFDWTQRKVRTETATHRISNCTHDVLSAIFLARNIPYHRLKPGAKIPFDLFLDDELHSVYIRYHGRETIKTKSGTFRAIKISPLLIEGTIFSGGEKMTIWVSDDANHVPLRVKSPILVGSIIVDLISYKNLAYPLSAQVSD